MGTVSLSAHFLRFLSTIEEKLALKLDFSRTLVKICVVEGLGNRPIETVPLSTLIM